MTLPDKLMVSLRLAGSGTPVATDVIAAFHGWIAARAFDEILIDVADYSHVPEGPGVVLIGYDHNYSVAQRARDIELSCYRKRETRGSNPLLQTLRRLLETCWLLRGPLGERGVELRSAAVEITVFDRLLTEHQPFRATELAWLVAEHLASAIGVRPAVTVASDTARPTLRAAWAVPAAVDSLLERLRSPGTGAQGDSEHCADVTRGNP
ncbi:MAG TPA: hypothetical protein VFU02_09445 [Polyangiaceae bacterium]|nr:hypothetical protein [Polyangiaceae bacterium]